MFYVSHSLAVFTLPLPPIVSRASLICFISMQTGAAFVFFSSIIEVCLGLGVTVVLGALLRSSFEGFDPFVLHGPTQLCSLYSTPPPPHFSSLLWPTGLKGEILGLR